MMMAKKKWMQNLKLDKGALRKKTKTKAGQNILASKLKTKPGDDKKTKKQKNLALIFAKFRKKKK
jgi:hypothetical protein